MDVNVLVVFYSRYGKTEKIALAAGVGAVQARANIRLRRLSDHADPAKIESDTAWKENLERMKMDYIAPREIDSEWADVLILAAPADSVGEMQKFLSSFSRKPLAQKIGAPFAFEAIYQLAASAGLIVVPADPEIEAGIDGAIAYGSRVAELARKIKVSR